MGAPVVHWEINARDARRLQRFYASLFDWTVDTDNPLRYGMVLTKAGTGINGGIGQNDPFTPAPGVTFYVQVHDPEAALDRAVSLGAKVITPVTEIPGMVTFALFQDPEGNIIGLLKELQIRAVPARAARRKATGHKRLTGAKAKTRTKGKAKRV
jgi:predicted enzyme related to lactoylglutathione lyase